MFRRLAAIAALAMLVLPPGTPARAEDDLVRQLVNSCTGCRFPKDLHGRDLHGLHFVGADLRGVDLSRANLNGASFVGSDLEDARFDDADLRNARFTGVRFRNTSFARAKVDGVQMEGVRLDARSVVGIDYKQFLRGCTGCDRRELAIRSALIPPDLGRALRELELHPPVIPAPMVFAPVRPFAVRPDLERRMQELEREMRDLRREMRVLPPAAPGTPPLPPAAPSAPVAPPPPVPKPG